MAKIPGFSSHVPTPQPIRHTRYFCKEEVAEALKFYLRAHGVEVPEGRTFVWGIETKACMGDEEETITLVIDER